MSTPTLTRRRALAGVTSVGLSLPVLSACGGGDPASPAETERSTTTDATGDALTAESTEPASTSDPTSDAPSEGAAGVVATADVPVGGGVILPEASVVVTQPTAGDVHVFSIRCTHTGCAVTGVTDAITCPCHGSSFDLTTGDPLSGPASAPLATVDFTLVDDQVVLS